MTEGKNTKELKVEGRAVDSASDANIRKVGGRYLVMHMVNKGQV